MKRSIAPDATLQEIDGVKITTPDAQTGLNTHADKFVLSVQNRVRFLNVGY